MASFDFSQLPPGTQVTDQYASYGISFQLVGGTTGIPETDGEGITNSTTANYPTANQLEVDFNHSESRLSFTFDNQGDNSYFAGGGSSYTAYDASGNVIATGSLTSFQSGTSASITGLVSRLVLDNGIAADSAEGNSWIFDLQSVTFTDPPTVTGTQSTTTSYQSGMAPFSGVTISDPITDATDSVTIALSGAAGTLIGTGLIANQDGTYSIAEASASTISTELQSLIFKPAVENYGPLETTTFSLAVTSSSGALTTDSATVYTVNSMPNQSRFGNTANSIDSAGGEIYALYEGLLGRSPDQTGAEQFVAELQSGTSIDQITQAFLGSSEGQGIFALGQTNDDFVNTLYQKVLGRAADASGEAYWNQQLADGASRSNVADGFVFSQEHTTDLQSAFSAGVFIADNATSESARLYYGIIDRAPDSDGLASNAQSLDNGTSLTGLAQSFLSSSEYQSDNATPLSNQDFVTSLYSNALGRAPDQAGGSYWTSQLDNGADSRAQVAVGIVQSAEAQQHLAGRIETGYHLA